MDEARKLLEGGVGDNLLVIADSQLSGRGRHQRSWESPKGNLYFSLAVPGFHKPDKTVGYSLVVGLAVLEYFLSKDIVLDLKWPNDIYHQGEKVGGLLIEIVKDVAIVGIGLNLVSAPAEVDGAGVVPGGEKQAVSLEQTARELSEQIIELSATFQREGFPPFQEKYTQSDCFVGKTLEVTLPNESIIGSYRGVNEKGGLLLDCNGEERELYSVECLRKVGR